MAGAASEFRTRWLMLNYPRSGITGAVVGQAGQGFGALHDAVDDGSRSQWRFAGQVGGDAFQVASRDCRPDDFHLPRLHRLLARSMAVCALCLTSSLE
jgi:hypothetical protein